MFQGSLVALVTPMKENQSIDFDGLKQLVSFHMENKTDGLVVAGTTGESAVLSMSEVKQLISAVVQQVKGEVPVIVGTSAQSTNQAILNTKVAEELGADGALIMTPAYIKPPQRGLFTHYKSIAESTALPIILYNVPGRTGCDLLPDTVLALSDISNIIAIKEACGDLARSQEIIDRCEEKLFVLSGEDSLAYEMMKQGAKGVISVTANIAPRMMHDMCQAMLDGNIAAAQDFNNRLCALHEVLFVESNPIPAKWALAQMRLCSASLRLPLVELSDEFHKECISILEKLSLV